MTITEVCVLPLKAGVDITDKSGQSYKSLESALAIVSRQPGYEEHWFGPVRERPDELQLYISTSIDKFTLASFVVYSSTDRSSQTGTNSTRT